MLICTSISLSKENGWKYSLNFSNFIDFFNNYVFQKWTQFWFWIFERVFFSYQFTLLRTRINNVLFLHLRRFEKQFLHRAARLCQNSLFDNSSIFSTAVIWHIFYSLVLSWPILDSLALFFLLIQSQYWST